MKEFFPDLAVIGGDGQQIGNPRVLVSEWSETAVNHKPPMMPAELKRLNQFCEIHSQISMPSLYHKGAGYDQQLGVLSVTHEIAQAHFERRGNAGKRINRNGFLHAFNFANVFRVQIRQFTQPLLRQFCLLAVIADGLAKRFTICGMCCHDWKRSRYVCQI